MSPAGRIRSCLPAPDALVGWLEALRLVCGMRMNPFRAGVIPTRPNCSEAPATVLRPVSRKAKSSLKAVCRLAWPEDRRGCPWGFAATANPWISAQKNRGLGLQLCAGIGAGGVRGGSLNIALRTPLNRAPAHPPFGGCRQIIPRLRNRRGPITASNCRYRARNSAP